MQIKVYPQSGYLKKTFRQETIKKAIAKTRAHRDLVESNQLKLMYQRQLTSLEGMLVKAEGLVR